RPPRPARPARPPRTGAPMRGGRVGQALESSGTGPRPRPTLHSTSRAGTPGANAHQVRTTHGSSTPRLRGTQAARTDAIRTHRRHPHATRGGAVRPAPRIASVTAGRCRASGLGVVGDTLLDDGVVEGGADVVAVLVEVVL